MAVMVETVVLHVAKKIGDVLVIEGITQAKALIKTLKKVSGEMHNIKSRLELMQVFLEYGDKHSTDNKLVAMWVKQIRELALDIEDLIDEYTYMIMRPRKKGRNVAVRLYNRLRKTKKIKALKEIAHELHNCNNKLNRLWEDKNTYGIDLSADDALISSSWALSESKQLAEYAHTIPDESIIGIYDQKAMLIDWLTTDNQAITFSETDIEESSKKAGKKPRRGVISVWGMGGVGKTTLVTNFYNSPSIVSYFGTRAWVSVSQNYNIYDLLKKIIKELQLPQTASDHSESYRDLVEMLSKLLMGKRYLIILDDVWISTVWQDLTNILQGINVNSKVIITTRVQDVARVADESYILELKPLDENDAMTLFCHHAFIKQNSKNCPPSLKKCAEKIVQRCGGLPLALVWIANYLATKEQSETAWGNVHSMLISLGERNGVIELNKIDQILSLSITNLPHHLRNCFLYCSIFSEDYMIKRKQLLRLWVSEGFVVNERIDNTKMKVAEDYLNQLVSHSMFEVVKRNEYGRAKGFRIHDLVRDMILEKQQSENFNQVCFKNIQTEQNGGKIRCLSIINLENDVNRTYYAPKLRSLHFFSISTPYLPFSKFKLLRVLNLEYANIESLPEEVGLLFNLRFLHIRGSKVRELPEGICKLQNLENLDIGYNWLKMPKGISKLEKLQHLQGHDMDGGDLKGIQNLKHLQTLKKIRIRGSIELLQELGTLTALKTLHIEIRIESVEESRKLSASITNMSNLTNLSIRIFGEQLDLDGGGLTKLPRGLHKLILSGGLQNGAVPKCLHIPNLQSLTLSDSYLEEDPIPIIAASLPNLRYLKLHGCLKEGEGAEEIIWFPAGSFPNLITLKMLHLPTIEMMEIHEDLLVCLENMYLNWCIGMKELPRGIENLTNLKELQLQAISHELIEKVHEERSSKLQHIPFIECSGQML